MLKPAIDRNHKSRWYMFSAVCHAAPCDMCCNIISIYKIQDAICNMLSDTHKTQKPQRKKKERSEKSKKQEARSKKAKIGSKKARAHGSKKARKKEEGRRRK